MARNSFYSGDAGADVTIDNSIAQAQLAENNAATSATAAASSATAAATRAAAASGMISVIGTFSGHPPARRWGQRHG